MLLLSSLLDLFRVVGQLDLNCLGVRVFLCEDYNRSSSSAMSVAFLGHFAMTSNEYGFRFGKGVMRPDLSVPAVILADVFPRGKSADERATEPKTTTVRRDLVFQGAIDNFVVELENSMEYDDANTVLEPVALNASYSSTTFDVVGGDQIMRSRFVGCQRLVVAWSSRVAMSG